jgi:DNA-binding Lrp family transcriptional regulator
MNVDKKDQMILRELSIDAKKTSLEIGKKTGLPPTTVHNRIKRLEKEGVILNYSANVNYSKTGRPIRSLIALTINYGLPQVTQFSVAKKLSALEGVKEVLVITGTVDMVVHFLAKDIDDLNDTVAIKFHQIKGIEKTQTMIVLRNFESLV